MPGSYGAIRGFNGDVELSVEPLIGWRGWYWNPGTERLTSLNNSTVWEPGEELHAVCTHYGNTHKAPAVDCNCGIFSMKAPQWLTNHVNPEDRKTVIGCVKIWGDFIEGSMGFRSEFALIDTLYVPCSDAEVDRIDLLKFMYDIDGQKSPTYLRSQMAETVEAIYKVPVLKSDPRETFVIPDEWIEKMNDDPHGRW